MSNQETAENCAQGKQVQVERAVRGHIWRYLFMPLLPFMCGANAAFYLAKEYGVNADKQTDLSDFLAPVFIGIVISPIGYWWMNKNGL